MLHLGRRFFLMIFDIICAVQEFYFKLDTRVNIRVKNFGQDWTSPSPLSCAVDSLRLFRSCSSITYDPVSKVCTPGTWLLMNDTIADLPPGHIYLIGGDCAQQQNFKFFRSEDAMACVWLSQDKQNYTNARNDCTERGAHLYTIRSVQKLAALNSSTYNQSANFWIGLDDIVEEDHFKWVDDQSELTPDLRTAIFRKGQPNNENDREDCVIFNSTFGLLNDDACSKQARFVCEKDLVYGVDR